MDFLIWAGTVINKLRLEDDRVRGLFLPHLHELKAMRHEMFHFKMGFPGSGAIAAWNWVIDLHEALEEHCRDYLGARKVRRKGSKRRLKNANA